MEQQIKLLKAVEETLEKVSVAGSENMDRQLGCIRAIQGVRVDLMKMVKEMNKNAPKHEGECGSTETSADCICGA